MRLRPLVLAFCVAFAASPVAWAQMQLTSSAPASLETMSAGAGRSLTTRGIASGLKLGDEAILHAGVFADIGYDSNVFYGSSGQETSGVLHVTPRLEITNAERDGSIPSGTYYDLVGSVDFVRYLSNEASSQDAINPSLGGTAEFSSGQALSFTLSETFSRYTQAPYAANGDPIIRDDNMVSASLRFAPGGGRLRIMLRYSNLIDKYEGTTYSGGSNMGNEGVLDIGWRWLPRTTIYAQVAQGAITYFNSGASSSASYPLRTLFGLRGLLTEKLSANIAAGYNNAFYSSGGSPTGFGNVGILAEVNYTISTLTRAGLGYHHDFVNSPFLGGYYNMDAIYGTFQQMVASRVVTYLFGRFENRRFATGRTDNNVMGGVALDYMVGKFLLAGASYSLNLNRTTSPTSATNPGLDYTKHVLLFRLGVMY